MCTFLVINVTVLLFLLYYSYSQWYCPLYIVLNKSMTGEMEEGGSFWQARPRHIYPLLASYTLVARTSMHPLEDRGRSETLTLSGNPGLLNYNCMYNVVSARITH